MLISPCRSSCPALLSFAEAVVEGMEDAGWRRIWEEVEVEGKKGGGVTYEVREGGGGGGAGGRGRGGGGGGGEG